MISRMKNKQASERKREWKWKCGVYCSDVRDWESSSGGDGEKLCYTSKIGN